MGPLLFKIKDTERSPVLLSLCPPVFFQFLFETKTPEVKPHRKRLRWWWMKDTNVRRRVSRLNPGLTYVVSESVYRRVLLVQVQVPGGDNGLRN